MRHAEPLIVTDDIRWMNLITSVLIGLILGGACIAAFLWFVSDPKFQVRTVEVLNGERVEHIDMQEVRQVASGIRENFFLVDLDKVKNVFESVPWVRHATIERAWPYKLKVTLQEYYPVALLRQGSDELMFLDESGRILAAGTNSLGHSAELPLLQGPNEDGVGLYMWSFYQQAAQNFAQLGLGVKALNLSEHGIWSLELSNGTQVVVGRGYKEDLFLKIANFVRTSPVALKPYGQRHLIRADLRYSNGYAVEVDGASTVVPR